jgi:hypothetical protein
MIVNQGSSSALIRFWKILYFKHLSSESGGTLDDADVYDIAMKEPDYHVIDTRFCMIFHPDSGWFLLEASGSEIIQSIECGYMGEKAK